MASEFLQNTPSNNMSMPSGPPVIQTQSGSSITQSQESHNRPLRPRMGVQHIRSKQVSLLDWPPKASCNYGSSVDEIGTVNSSTVSNRLRRRPSLLLSIHEQDQSQPGRSGQLLLNKMIPTKRRPIKAKHAIHNENVCQFTQVTNQQTVFANYNNTIGNSENDLRHSGWDTRQLNSPVRLPLASSPFCALSPCQNDALCIDPVVRRRVSADVTPVSAGVKRIIDYTDDTSTPAKRKCSDYSPMTSYPNRVNGNYKSSEYTSETIHINETTSSAVNTSDINSSSHQAPTNKRRSLTMKCYNKLTKNVTKQLIRRNSTGSSKVSKPCDRLSDNSNHRKPNMLNVIKRSARRTLGTIRDMLRPSNSPTSVVSSSSEVNETKYESQCDDQYFVPPDQVTSLTASSLDEGLDGIDEDHGLVHADSNSSYSLRYVTLSKSSQDSTFGLFVTKSNLGYRVTRLTVRLILNNSSPLRIGDEIIQVNGIDCRQLDIDQMQELFRQNQTIQLTIIDE
ncbi:unnamed protein product [Trichobilharzia szidati]|nr:unnamed protein product [Trichobilharzia szidati]